MSEKISSVHYINYLSLDKILDASIPSQWGRKRFFAHEEMLFIIIHQTYRLWFKQIIHEINSIMDLFKDEKIDEKNVGVVVSRMDRVNKIMSTLIGQLEILETMTSLDFLDFRDQLSPIWISTHQFRKLEVMKAGLKLGVINLEDTFLPHQFEGKKKKEILELEDNYSLFNVEKIELERIPFLNINEFDFTKKYDSAVKEMLNKEIEGIKTSSN